MLKLLKYLTRQDRMSMAACMCLVVLQVWLDLTMPDYTQALTAAVSAGNISMQDVLRNGGMMLLCALGSMASSILCGFLTARIAASYARTLREKLFDRITDFSDADIGRFTVASLITRTTNDVVQMQSLIAIGMQLLIKAPITAVWAILKISSASVEWTQATMITVAVIVSFVAVLILIAFPRFRKIQKLTDALNHATEENLEGVRVIRAFNAEAYQARKFEQVNQDITRNHLFTARAMGLMFPVMSMAMSGLTLAIYWIGAYLMNAAPILQRATLIGNMTAYTQYAIQVVMSFMMLVAIFIIIPRVMVSAGRIREVLETEPSMRFPENDGDIPSGARIEFRHVSFSYQNGEENCLKDLNFTIEPGQTFAIIGATGCGKTSLVNLIPRLYDVTEGEVLINGRDIRTYAQKTLEHLVSVAPQKAMLFMGDVKSNITYGCGENIPDDSPRIREALDIAQAGFVDELPLGVHAPVAQGGTNFSGGQKQRLSIARAVFRRSPVMIFDDTFSALDFQTDMRVRQAIHDRLKGCTSILVAQRIGTVRQADQILVLDNGSIAGIGRHEELLQSCSVYREIALSQLREEEL